MEQNKPGVMKVTKVERKNDGSFELTGVNGQTVTLANTFAPQIAGSTDGYVITESSGKQVWQSTGDYESQQKQQNQPQQPAQVHPAAANVVSHDDTQDIDKTATPSARPRSR